MQISPLFFAAALPHLFLPEEISFLRLDSSRQRSGNYGHVLLVRRRLCLCDDDYCRCDDDDDPFFSGGKLVLVVVLVSS